MRFVFYVHGALNTELHCLLRLRCTVSSEKLVFFRACFLNAMFERFLRTADKEKTYKSVNSCFRWVNARDSVRRKISTTMDPRSLRSSAHTTGAAVAGTFNSGGTAGPFQPGGTAGQIIGGTEEWFDVPYVYQVKMIDA